MKQITKKKAFEGVHFKNNVARAFDYTDAELLDDSFQKLDKAF